VRYARANASFFVIGLRDGPRVFSGCVPGHGWRPLQCHRNAIPCVDVRDSSGEKRQLRARELTLDDLGVTPHQFAVLTMLAAYPGISGADVARLAALTPQRVSVIVANIERSGAIGRRPHAVHGRIQQIEIAAQGEALLKQCRVRVRKVEAGMVEGFTPAEEQVIRRWLVSVARET
jgi:DNA-binding MarR family transcriptional regulator